MTDQDYTDKEDAKSALLDALVAYVAAAEKAGFDDNEQMQELTDLLYDAGEKWSVIDGA